DLINFIVNAEGSENLISIKDYTKLASTDSDARNYYLDYMKQGFEGAMVRNKNSKYAWERVKIKDGILTKLKPHDHADCEIIGYYEGKDGNTGKLGGFTLKYNDHIVDCGGGFKKWMREEYWKDPESYVGQWCRVKYTELTPDGN